MMNSIILNKKNIIPILLVYILIGCDKKKENEISNNSKISIKNSATIANCNDFLYEKEEFYNKLTKNEIYKLNLDIGHLYSISDKNIYLKYDLTNNLLIEINKLSDKYNNLSESNYFKDLNDSLNDDLNSFKIQIENEANYYSHVFKKSYKKIINDNDEYLILDSLNEESKNIEIHNLKKGTKYNKIITNNDDFSNIFKFKKVLDQHSVHLHNKFSNNEHLNIAQPSIGLSHAYLLKNIIDYFNNEQNGDDDSDLNPILTKIVKAQVYTNMVQLSLDVADSALKTAHVIDVLKSNEFNTFNSFKAYAKYTSKINVGLNFLNVAYDAFELKYAKTNSQITRYKTQLGFDSASSALILSGMVLGETTAGTFLSGIGEIFGGLAVGFSAYAEVVGSNIDIALNNANYFRFYADDHRKILNSSTFVPNSGNKVLSLANKYINKNGDANYKEQLNIVVNEIDLTKEGYYKIIFGDHITYPISRHESGAIYYDPFAPDPELMKNSNDFVKFREALELPKEKEFQINQIQKIILPNQAQNLITYQHAYAPWITYRYDAEMDAARIIQRNAKFIFDYTIMRGAGDKAILGLNFDSKNTEIKIKLNSNNSGVHFISPEIHDKSKNKITYIFDVNSDNKNSENSYHLHLNKHASYKINSLKKDNWHFHIDSRLVESNFLEQDGELNFRNNENNFSIDFGSNKPNNIYIHDKMGITYLVYGDNQSKFIPVKVELNADVFSSNSDLFYAVEQISANCQNILKYITIKNFKQPSKSNKETIFYDMKKNSYIYSGLNIPDLKIIGKTDFTNIFYDRKNKNLFYKDKILNNIKEMHHKNDKYIITTQNGNNLNTYEINNSVLEITETSNINLNRDIFSKLVRIVNPSNHKTSKFFIPSKNQEIALNDLEAKIIHSYKDKNGDIYYFISGNKFYIVKLTRDNNIINKQFNLKSIQKEDIFDGNIVFSSDEFIYKLSNNLELNIAGVKPLFLTKNNGLTVTQLVNKIQTSENKISIIINENDFAEYYRAEKLVYLHSENKIPIGESVKNPNIYYFYNSFNKKYFYINKNYLNPNNFTVSNGNKLIYNGSKIDWTEENEDNVYLRNADKNKLLTILLDHIHNKVQDISIENCQHANFNNQLLTSNLKNTLCKIGKNSNEYNVKFITAYSKTNETTLILDSGSFKQLNVKTGKYISEGTEYESWGAGDWIANLEPYTTYNKLFAFGELKSEIQQSANTNSHFFSDIRFVDTEGNILKAISGVPSLNTKKYSVEKKLDKNYALSVFGSFALNKSGQNSVFFLKRDLKFDELDAVNYNVINSGKLSDLLYMIPSNDIQFIQYVIKTDAYIALYKTIENKLDGYYLISANDLLNKSGSDKVLYIKL